MIVVVNSGTANVGSIVNMLKKVGATGTITEDPEVVRRAERLILPGVGSFDAGVNAWRKLGMWDCLEEVVLQRGIPCLGVCLGMQMMCRGSEEGEQKGLGWFEADVVRLPRNTAEGVLRVPHMGWNRIVPRQMHPVLEGLTTDARFYFVHSYCVQADRAEDVVASCHYGIDFACAIGKNNVVAVQFHPEKSHRFGMNLMANFVRWQP
ncbi:MAG: imidazole glycerol phosphate synthase subunit HisH [Gammaproteobacteria bacterium]|nr:imidazole glycerol phosphate synthase subunit HisH [Gammaproteobacteria bacterium]